MSKIEDMIKKLCPNGVEYKKLGEVCDVFDGTHQTPKYTDSGIKFVSVENINDLYASNKFISLEDYKKNFKNSPQINDVLMTRIGSIGSCAVIDRNEDLAYYVSLALLRPNIEIINSKFLKYTIESSVGKSELRKRTLINAVPIKINLGDISKIEIPIPPIEIQQEIVRILDNFTNLTAELQAELQARKEQYEYYRNNLLTFDKDNPDVKWMKMGEIGTFIRGNGLQKKDFVESGVGCIHYGQIYTYYGTSAFNTKTFVTPQLASKLKKAKHGDLIITTTSENVEDICKVVAWLGNDEIAIGGHSAIFRHNENPKYLAYLSQTDFFFKLKRKVAIGAKVIDVSPNKMSEFVIPIPPLAEQERIVFILDKFEALVNDLSTGLPAEIAALQEQYEYYRNKLLTFEKAV